MRILAKQRAEAKSCSHAGCEETSEYHCDHCDTWYCPRHAGRAGNGKLRGAHRASRSEENASDS